ncbi:MAG TPA: anti-sigma factor [Pyrinomonadaceae bacterium]|jgi:hypothetical protein
MNCVETKNNIEALLDGELDDITKDAVEHHLWICPACLKWKERMASFSSLLQTSNIPAPSPLLDERVMKSFEIRNASESFWHRVVFGKLAVPKPVFAALLLLMLCSIWLAFQAGKINSTEVSMTAPSIVSNEIPVQNAEPKIQTVEVEVPVIKEKTVTRIVYVRETKNTINEKNETNTTNEKGKSGVLIRNDAPQFSSTVTDKGFFTDVSLKGFEPSAEINAKIIKEVKENEQ